MITLGYAISENWRTSWERIDLALATESDLLYKVLLGDFRFLDETADFSSKWGWVPIVNFAASLKQVADAIGHHHRSDELLSFTESDAFLQFVLRDNKVHVSASYAGGEISSTLDEFSSVVDSYVSDTHRRLIRDYSALSKNRSFDRLLGINASQA